MISVLNFILLTKRVISCFLILFKFKNKNKNKNNFQNASFCCSLVAIAPTGGWAIVLPMSSPFFRVFPPSTPNAL